MSCPPHPADRVELRKKPAVGGGVFFALQCQQCLRQVGGRMPLERVPDPRSARPWSKGKRPTARRREFSARFKRGDWKKLRDRVLERDRWTCRLCGEAASEVHHTTYENFGQERLGDLVASCSDCNQAERQMRITKGVLG